MTEKNTDTTWQDPHLTVYPALKEDITTDVIIVGGGITGITTAYLLSKAGKKVVVLEKDSLNETVTARTTAFLMYAIDTSFSDLISMFGLKKAKQVFESGIEAIDRIEKNIKDEMISAEFMRLSAFIFANKKKQKEGIFEDAKAAKEHGFSFETHESSKLPFKNAGSIEIKNQGKFHPIKYLRELRKRAEDNGAVFYEGTEVCSVEGDEEITAKTKNGKIIKGKNIIICTYVPLIEPGLTSLKKGKYLSYVYELEIPKNTFPEGLYLDADSPYHYIRIDKNESAEAVGDRMILGGEDHRKELPMKSEMNFNPLIRYGKRILGNTEYKIKKMWLGTMLEPTDGLPLIGRLYKDKPNQYVATAFSGNGMTYGTISAMMFTDMILGRKNKWEELYNPRRIYNLKSLYIKARDYIGVFFHGAVKNYIQALEHQDRIKKQKNS